MTSSVKSEKGSSDMLNAFSQVRSGPGTKFKDNMKEATLLASLCGRFPDGSVITFIDQFVAHAHRDDTCSISGTSQSRCGCPFSVHITYNRNFHCLLTSEGSLLAREDPIDNPISGPITHYLIEPLSKE